MNLQKIHEITIASSKKRLDEILEQLEELQCEVSYMYETHYDDEDEEIDAKIEAIKEFTDMFSGNL